MKKSIVDFPEVAFLRVPGDLLHICEALFKGLWKLGFQDLRNTMINIHDA